MKIKGTIERGVVGSSTPEVVKIDLEVEILSEEIVKQIEESLGAAMTKALTQDHK